MPARGGLHQGRERREPPAGMAGGSRRRSPEGIRTLATAVRGRRPGPLDDGAVHAPLDETVLRTWCFLAGVPGLEPRLTEPETVGLPITPYPKGGAAPCGAENTPYLTLRDRVSRPPGRGGRRLPRHRVRRRRDR